MSCGSNLIMQLSVEDEVMVEWSLLLLTVLVKSRWRKWAGILNPTDRRTS